MEEENKQNPPEAGQELPPLPEKPVKITVTKDGESMSTELEMHLPTMAKAAKEAADGSTVKVEIAQYATEKGESELKPGERPKVVVTTKTAFEGPRDEAVRQLEHACIPGKSLALELYKFAQYVIDHSDLQAVGVSLVYKDAEGNDSAAGFVQTAKHCTSVNAIQLVNCMDANTQEFITKAGLEIPGRNAPKAEGIILPTDADKEKLGL